MKEVVANFILMDIGNKKTSEIKSMTLEDKVIQAQLLIDKINNNGTNK